MAALIHSIVKALPLAGLIFTLTINVASAENYYKWTDDKGVTHYSEKSPKNTPTVKGRTHTGHSAPTTYASVKAAKEIPAPTNKPQNLKDPARCKIAKSDLQSIDNSSRIKVKGENGAFRFLSKDEIAKRKKETIITIKKSC